MEAVEYSFIVFCSAGVDGFVGLYPKNKNALVNKEVNTFIWKYFSMLNALAVLKIGCN